MNVKLFNNPLYTNAVTRKSLQRKCMPPDVWMSFEVAQTSYKGQSMLLLKQIVDQSYTPKQLR